MKELLWILAVTADVIHGYPGQVRPRQQPISSNGVPINASFTSGLFPTTSKATGSRINGITFSSPVTPSGSSTPSSSSSVPSNIDSSTFISINTNTSSTTNILSTSPTRLSSNGPSTITPTIANDSTNGTAIFRTPPAGNASTGNASTSTGRIPIGTPLSIHSLEISSSNDPSSSTPSRGTITSAASLPTFSVISLSTQSTSIAGVTSNTEITTDNNGHHTVVPFLWGCWFCGGAGLLLWGVGPLPGVYPPPASPPFPSWPVITIGNDKLPTPGPYKNDPINTSPPQTNSLPPSITSVNSRSSCTGTMNTDYWVSCSWIASGTTSSCSTFSSSLASGCSLRPITTTTTVSSCTAPASVDSGNLLPGEMAGVEYDFVDPRESESITQWTYTKAVIASTGTARATGLGSTSGSTTVTGSIAVAPSILLSITPRPATTNGLQPLCVPVQDLDNGVTGYCDCSSGSFITTAPFQTATNNPCGYTTLSVPPPRLTAPPTTTNISTAPPKSSSTSPPPLSSPPQPPSADCDFWDRGWGWTFEVYNISGWSTDGGKGLHHQEDGCGTLTGWSWASSAAGSQAYFNLDFFIKKGCVERAIASAGGPKISCKGQGHGKRAVDSKPRANAAIPTTKPPNFNNKTVANAYNPPNVDVTTISHTYEPESWDYTTHSLGPSELYEGDLLLNKRGCRSSKPVAPSPGGGSLAPVAPPLICDPTIPGVNECNAQIAAHGNVGRKTSLFYTGWGATGAPGAGGNMARKYASKYLCGMDTVSWAGLCDGEWRAAVQKAIVAPFRRPGMSNDEIFALNAKADPFLKNLAQAFAESSKGDVYVFIPQGRLPGNHWDMESAWGGWEYPALTANQDVQRILRVDLDTDDPEDPNGTPEVIFDRGKGDGTAQYEPKGTRGPSLPVGLPVDPSSHEINSFETGMG